MKNKLCKALSIIIALNIMLAFFNGCSKKNSREEKKTDNTIQKPVEITIGSPAGDPTYKDPITGEYVMNEASRVGAFKGMEVCKDRLNVKLNITKYPGDVNELLLKSVISGDPICDIAEIPGRLHVVIGQNVLQKLDPYLDDFKDPEYQWMMVDDIYGGHYLLNMGLQFIQTRALVYNLSYLNKVDSLKKNGEIVLPIDLWKDGEWTWKKFEEYLGEVNGYYSTKKAPIRVEKYIRPYATDVKMPVVSAIKSTGETIFGSNGMNVDSDNVKKAVAYIDDLVDKKLISQAEGNKRDLFKNGETVFCDLNSWETGSVAEAFTQRGESLGIVPFPRPDDLPMGSEKYQQLVNLQGKCGILKGISKEKSKIAVDVIRVFYGSKIKERLATDSIVKYFRSKNSAKVDAGQAGYDVLNDKYGDTLVEAFMAYNPKLRDNEAYPLTPWATEWENLITKSILGMDNYPKYDEAIAEHKQLFVDSMNNVKALLNTDKVKDNIPPSIKLIQSKLAFPKSTDANTIDWSKYIEVRDNINGDIDIKSAVIKMDKVKINEVGIYDKGLSISVKDKEENEKMQEYTVIVFDPENKKAPILEAKDEYRSIKKNEDTSKINWAKDFIEKAESTEGFDIKSNVSADVSNLDITKSGEYEVPLSVKDYSGNRNEIKIKVKVEG